MLENVEHQNQTVTLFGFVIGSERPNVNSVSVWPVVGDDGRIGFNSLNISEFCKPIEEKSAADYGVDIAPRLKVLKTTEPASRKAGEILASAGELVDKLQNEAGVI